MSQKYKEAETYLKDYFNGKLEEDAQRRKEEILYPPKRPLLKGQEQTTMVQSSPSHDQLEREVLSYVEDGTYVYIKGQIRRIEKCLEYIKRVDKLDYEILKLYYKHGKSWENISYRVSMSAPACVNRRNKAINELKRWI